MNILRKYSEEDLGWGDKANCILPWRLIRASGKADVRHSKKDRHHLTQDINDNENPNGGLLLNTKGTTTLRRNMLENGQRMGR